MFTTVSFTNLRESLAGLYRFIQVYCNTSKLEFRKNVGCDFSVFSFAYNSAKPQYSHRLLSILWLGFEEKIYPWTPTRSAPGWRSPQPVCWDSVAPTKSHTRTHLNLPLHSLYWLTCLRDCHNKPALESSG